MIIAQTRLLPAAVPRKEPPGFGGVVGLICGSDVSGPL
jgi:hypothetical protein